MKKEFVCVICPRGCGLRVTGEPGAYQVEGNLCPRGAKYAVEEATDPRRTVTSTVRVSNRAHTMVSVKTSVPVRRDDIFRVMGALRSARAEAPIRIGEILLRDVCGADIIATREID